MNQSLSGESMNAAAGAIPRVHHRGPHPGVIAIVFTILFLAGLAPVTTLGGLPYFPSPSESAATIQAFFLARPAAALLCAFLHFGAAIPLGIFTATMVSQLRFLGVRAAGTYIALFGGLATVFDMLVSSSVLWAMAHPGIAHDATLTHALYWLQIALGGPGYSVPLGILIAGISVTAAFRKLLPRWLVILGLSLAVCGALSWFYLITAKALFLIPLTRFPGFLWMIAAGFALPRTTLVRKQ